MDTGNALVSGMALIGFPFMSTTKSVLILMYVSDVSVASVSSLFISLRSNGSIITSTMLESLDGE